MYEAARRYRFYPTSEQKIYLAQTFGCVRLVYNKALEARQDTYQETGKSLNLQRPAEDKSKGITGVDTLASRLAPDN